MSAVLVSVVVPVYNTGEYLARCLNSLQNQTYRNLEIICVNDGSTDGSAAILDEYAARDARIKVIHQENAGVSVARNRGLGIARGDIIGFCDADDVYVDTALAQVVSMFAVDEYSMVVTGWSFVDDRGKRTPMHVNISEVCAAKELQERMMFQDCIMGSVCNKFFPSHKIKGIEFDTGLTHCEDMHFVSQALRRMPREKVLITPIVTYEYHCNPVSATKNKKRLLDARGRLCYLSALDAILALYPKDGRMWLLIRSGQFRLIEENIDHFLGEKHVVRVLAWGAMRYLSAYIMCRKRYSLRERCRRALRMIGLLWYAM